MDQYKRLPKAKETIKPNEIRVTTQGRPRSYISYTVGLFDPELLKQQQQQGGDQEVAPVTATGTPQQYDTVVLKAMRRAINKAVNVAEIVKRRVRGLHQTTEIHSTAITDTYEPLEEGLPKVNNSRTVSSITITLSKKPLDTNHSGYQPPLPDSLIEPFQAPTVRSFGGPSGQQGGDVNAEGDHEGQRGRGRGRGRGRRRFGRGRRGGRGGAPRGDFQGGAPRGDFQGAQHQQQPYGGPQHQPYNQPPQQQGKQQQGGQQQPQQQQGGQQRARREPGQARQQQPQPYADQPNYQQGEQGFDNQANPNAGNRRRRGGRGRGRGGRGRGSRGGQGGVQTGAPATGTPQ